jgi:guanosine-3',5'-bis(diphosphate) 3'-pyrophosphohydrolase
MEGGQQTTAPDGHSVRGSELLRLCQADLPKYRTADDHVVSISSRLGEQFKGKQLALMDLHLDEFVTRRSLEAAVRTLCRGNRYWLLRTDRQFHVYGDFLLDDGEDWRGWNLRFQLPLALTNDRYVAQSLLWGCNLLRLTDGGRFPTTVPQTVGGEPDARFESLAPTAVQLAQRKHWWQVRRGGTPYVEHLSNVASLAVTIREECLALGILRAGEASAEELYACGYLHDCIEDTDTDYDEVVEAAGSRVAGWVVDLSDDKRRPEPQRLAEYLRQLERASLPARIVKLADLLSNLQGLTGHEDESWMDRYLPKVAMQLRLIGAGLDGCPSYGSAVRLVEQRRRELGSLSRNPALPNGAPSSSERAARNTSST